MKVMVSTMMIFRRIRNTVARGSSSAASRNDSGQSGTETRKHQFFLVAIYPTLDENHWPLRSTSSFAGSASAAPLPYSLSLLWRVFRLMPRISAALVLLLLVDSSVLRINIFSASPTVVPT